MNKFRNLFFIVSGLSLASCASIDNAMKSPVGAVTTYDAISSDTSTDVMPLRAMDDQGHIVPKGTMGAFKQPLFYAYDVSTLETSDFEALAKSAGKKEEDYRNELIEKILYQSDKNFDQYSRRVLALDRGTSFTQKMIDSLSTATIGGTALFSGPAAAVIGGVKLVGDSTAANAKAVYLGNQTVDAVLGAMATARQKQEAAIFVGLYGEKLTKGSPNAYANYTILDGLKDIYKLEQAGTIFGALDAINAANAASTKTSQDLQNSMKTGGGDTAKAAAKKLISP